MLDRASTGLPEGFLDSISATSTGRLLQHRCPEVRYRAEVQQVAVASATVEKWLGPAQRPPSRAACYNPGRSANNNGIVRISSSAVSVGGRCRDPTPPRATTARLQRSGLRSACRTTKDAACIASAWRRAATGHGVLRYDNDAVLGGSNVTQQRNGVRCPLRTAATSRQPGPPFKLRCRDLRRVRTESRRRTWPHSRKREC